MDPTPSRHLTSRNGEGSGLGVEMREQLRHALGPIAAAAALLSPLLMGVLPARAAATLLVPEQYPTIAAAVSAAVACDVIDVAPGVYAGGLTLNKSVTIRGRTPDTTDPRNNGTILDGGGVTPITVPSGVSPGPTLVGLVFRNGEDGVSTRSPVAITGSSFIGNVDHIDVALGGGGRIADNVFRGSGDDSVDIDHLIRAITVEDNLMLDSHDDGIEMRLHDDTIATTAVATFRGNRITGGRDGIQIIDYYTDTNRRIVIERNLIHDVERAAIGLLDNEVTNEDFRAASIRERIEVVHNTLLRNDHGISGGDNLVAINNIIAGHVVGMKNVDAGSIASRNLFWNNATHTVGSNVEFATVADPFLDAASVPQSGSPAIDAGWASFTWGGGVVTDQPPGSYGGAAPDLGWRETAGTAQNDAPIVNAGPDQSITLPDGASLTGSVTDDGRPAPPSLQTAWSQVSGPGAAVFADPASPVTTVTFDLPGSYVLRLTGDDGELTSFDELTVVVLDADPGNGPPEVISVVISPTSPRTNDLLTASAVANDPDGDPVTLSYRWTRNGSEIVGQTSSTLSLASQGHGDEGDQIAVVVVASDGEAGSAPRTSAPVTVVDSPPVFSQNLSDRTDDEGDIVSLSAAATDADGEVITYTAAGLPPGVSIDAATGAIGGTISTGASTQGPYATSVTLVQGAEQGPTDTFTWTVLPPPPPPAIAFRGVSSAAVKGKTAVMIPRPAGVAAGDVELATILIQGTPAISPPEGWSLVRTDVVGTSGRQAIFLRVAQASEPASYRFTVSVSTGIAAIVVAYDGVDPTNPMIASSGAGAADASVITAPSVANSVGGATLVGSFGIVPTLAAEIAPPATMIERAETGLGGKPRPRLALADQALLPTGDTGSRSAGSTRSGPAIGQLVLMRPAPAT